MFKLFRVFRLFKLPKLKLAGLLTVASIAMVTAPDICLAQTASRTTTAGYSYNSPSDNGNNSAAGISGADNPLAGTSDFSDAGHNSYRQFPSVTNIEKSNPYSNLSSPSSLNSEGQFLGRSDLDPDSLNKIARPGGLYGNFYDSQSTIINPYSQYGSTNSVSSAVNPYAAGIGPLLNSHDQRPTFPNYDQLGGGIQRWYP